MADEYRVTQHSFEAMTQGTPNPRVTQHSFEAMAHTTPMGRVTQFAFEVMVPARQPGPKIRRRMVIVENS